MPNRSESIVITRQRVGHLGSYVTGVALLAAILSFLWTGASGPATNLLVAAGVSAAVWVSFAPRDFVSFITGRQTRYSAIAFFSALFLAGIVGLTFVLTQRAAITFDLTGSRSFTLSRPSLDVIRQLNHPVQITGFYSSRALLQREIDDQFFRLYETASQGLIRRVYIDPDEAPAMAAAFGVPQGVDGAIFVSYLLPDGGVDFARRTTVPRNSAGGNQERDMTEALMRLMIAGTLAVYFDTSYGSRDPLDNTQEGISGIRSGMQANGFSVQPLSITQITADSTDVPLDAAAILLVRPLTEYTEAETATIDRYLDRGGSVFIMADVLFNDNPFLKQNGILNIYLWNNFGIRALDAAVVDPVASGQTALEVLSARVFTGTVLVNMNPETDPAVFRLARPVEIQDLTARNIANGLLIQSSEAAYGESNLTLLGQTNTYAFDDGEDPRGPLTIAAWAQDLNTNGRVVLVGDSDFVSNGVIGSYLGNGIFFTESMTWLTGISDRISFPPDFLVNVPVVPLLPAQRAAILLGVAVLAPGLVLGTGIYLRMRRSRR
jgi:hypothetical protein